MLKVIRKKENSSRIRGILSVVEVAKVASRKHVLSVRLGLIGNIVHQGLRGSSHFLLTLALGELIHFKVYN